MKGTVLVTVLTVLSFATLLTYDPTGLAHGIDQSQPCSSRFVDQTSPRVKAVLDMALRREATSPKRTKISAPGIIETRQDFRILLPSSKWVAVSTKCTASCSGKGNSCEISSNGCSKTSSTNCGGSVTCSRSDCTATCSATNEFDPLVPGDH